MKKETLEEAIKREYETRKFNSDFPFDPQSFKLGAKWQSKRMYSEADKIMKFLDNETKLGLSDGKTIERIKWYFETYFEQFKKK